MITVHAMGRLGNCMFQYAFNRLLAGYLGYRMKVASVPLAFDHLLPVFPNIQFQPDGIVVDGRAVEAKDGQEFVLGEASYQWPNITLGEIAADLMDKRVCSIGYWERGYWYAPERERLRHWFAFKHRPPVNCTVVSLRGGDARRHTLEELPYYRRALEQVGGTPVIVTDDPEWDKVKEFKLPVFHHDVADDFAYVAAASETLIIGRSTFAWWAGFLGNAKRVIQPLPAHSFRSREQYWNDLSLPQWEQQPL